MRLRVLGRAWSAVLAVMVGMSSSAVRADRQSFFRIAVIDEETGRGVPLVELRTVNSIRCYTDSAGIVAFDEPGLFDQQVFFHVSSHGYEYPKDGFGNRGLRLMPRRGGSAKIKIKRLNIAERLYRVTGQGIYRDSVLAGEQAPLKRPLLNGQVTGQDTVIATPYRNKIHWFWGDTDRVSYPLGNFAASGATSELPGAGGLDPGRGVDLTYFVDESGFSRKMCPEFGPGLQWIEGVFALPDESGRERLLARVVSVKTLGQVNDLHLAMFNDEKGIFESIERWDVQERHDSAHPFRVRVGAIDYLYLYPNLRVLATLESVRNLSEYEALTCLAPGTQFAGAESQIDRDAEGRARYTWQRGAGRLHADEIRKLVSTGKLKAEEAWMRPHDIESGKPVNLDRGSVCWNPFRKRWIMIASGQPGEIWFTEADTPTGPWVYARRIVTHDRYNFYNPTQHPFFDQEGGRVIYFEGTYTAAFAGAPEKTPRYDYNQIMYRLSLDDPRLQLPAPVYRRKGADGGERLLMRDVIERENAWRDVKEVAFFAIPPYSENAKKWTNPLSVLVLDGDAAPIISR